ncbi:hypothetical protein [Shewanella surugensis]|uniref:Uncharacterized protein n=1 Tax=Shewanella surugensis TaxID=212020 RepID=A0ABT0LBP6_9GAMM|nr:hypothetical protein [Shewanella surugensis]MCL1125111.1 hypothetical protein [Shewanella surugensis]
MAVMFFSIIMNCRKYVEVCEKYGAELNKEIPDIKVLKGKYVEEINRNSAIADLRNHYVAHVQKKSEKRALSDEDVQNYILSMVGGDNASEFINWICPDDFEKSNREDSLVGVIEIIKDKVVKRYNKN